MATIRLSLVLLLFVCLDGPAFAERIPPPVYDFCDAVIDASDLAVYTGSNCDGENLVLDHDCGPNVIHNGNEDYYAFVVNPGHRLFATVAHDGDAALMLTAECVVYGTLFTCLAGADEEGLGGIESIDYVNETGAPRTVYLVIDSSDVTSCGAYTLISIIHHEVGATNATFGDVKSRDR